MEEKPGKKLSAGLMGKMRRGLQSRLAQFDNMPALERERVQRAYGVGLETAVGGKLSRSGLHAALADLGLQGQTAREREAIRRIVESTLASGGPHMGEFAFHFLPLVKQALLEQRQELLHHYFAALDDGSGSIRQHDCLRALMSFSKATRCMDDSGEHDLWEGFVREFPAVVKRTLGGNWANGGVDFLGFQSIAAEFEKARADFRFQAEKRAAQIGYLSPTAAGRHFGEIAHLRRMFSEFAEKDAPTHYLCVDKTLVVLMNCGILPVVGKLLPLARSLLEERQRGRSPNDGIRFGEFLQVATKLREEEAKTSRIALSRAMKDMGAARRRVPCRRVPLLFARVSLCTESCNSMQALAAAVEDCNHEGLDIFSLSELLALLARVAESVRASARGREDAVAAQLGLGTLQVLELRFSWARLTPNGVAYCDTVRQLLSEVNPNVSPSDADILALVQEVSPTPPPDPLPLAEEVARATTAAADEGVAAMDSAFCMADEEEEANEHDVESATTSSSEVSCCSTGKEEKEQEEEKLPERIQRAFKLFSGPNRGPSTPQAPCAVLRFDGYLRLIGRLIDG